MPGLGLIRDAEPSTVCPACGLRSYNPKDIAEAYCGNCHNWHYHLIAQFDVVCCLGCRLEYHAFVFKTHCCPGLLARLPS